MQKLYFTREAAEILEVTPKTVRKYCQSGLLEAKFIGCKWYILEENLEKFIKPDIVPDIKIENDYHGDIKRVEMESIEW
ncbi:MAG: helix-turn-helix domain-containing protein [Oscillospiraceae bacterium]|nr:helix-turn-helix domain-containing protein [Oscillospiraceae bacterium]